jgi:hypothetical protein
MDALIGKRQKKSLEVFQKQYLSRRLLILVLLAKQINKVCTRPPKRLPVSELISK